MKFWLSLKTGVKNQFRKKTLNVTTFGQRFLLNKVFKKSVYLLSDKISVDSAPAFWQFCPPKLCLINNSWVWYTLVLYDYDIQLSGLSSTLPNVTNTTHNYNIYMSLKISSQTDFPSPIGYPSPNLINKDGPICIMQMKWSLLHIFFIRSCKFRLRLGVLSFSPIWGTIFLRLNFVLKLVQANQSEENNAFILYIETHKTKALFLWM